MWTVEGFITSDKLNEGDALEDVARAYLDELVHRCMVQITWRNYEGKVKRIRVHDLVRDLCIKKAKEEDFLETLSSESPNSDTMARRAAIYSRNRTVVRLPTKNQHLHSLFCKRDDEPEFQVTQSLEVIYQSFKLLRILMLEGVLTSDGSLPTGIGRLIHLRYLGLRGTNITQLLSSIGKLRNLLTLEYRGIKSARIQDVRIPDVVGEIEGLRHLYLPREDGVIVKLESFKFHTLKNLQTLSMGSIGGSWMFKELPRLSPSLQKLRIRGIASQKQLDAAFQCPVILKSDRLHSLDLRWHNAEAEEGEKEVKLDSIESIIHSQHLRKLKLCGRMGDGLARCGIQFHTCISKLELCMSKFGSEASLIALGKLPHLIILKLLYESYIGTSWTCSTGEFSQLKELYVVQLLNLEEWSIERGAMPQLERLDVGFCGKLSRIPEGLKFITTLHELLLGFIFTEFHKRIEGEEYHLTCPSH